MNEQPASNKPTARRLATASTILVILSIMIAVLGTLSYVFGFNPGISLGLQRQSLAIASATNGEIIIGWDTMYVSGWKGLDLSRWSADGYSIGRFGWRSCIRGPTGQRISGFHTGLLLPCSS